MNKLMPDEYLLEGQWHYDGQKVTADDVCKRIEWLISEALEVLGSDELGWEKLYRDSNDNRLWLLYYPQDEIHGGGPPSLKLITESESKRKFNVQ